MPKRTRTPKTESSVGQAAQPTDPTVNTQTDPNLNANPELRQDEAIAPISGDAHTDISDDSTPNAALEIQIDPATSPYPLEAQISQIQEDIEALPLIEVPDQRDRFHRSIQSRIAIVLTGYGQDGMEALLNLFQDYKGLQGIREAEAKPHYERYSSIKSLADETDAARRLIQREVIGHMLTHPDQFIAPDGKLRVTTLSYKVSVTEKGDRPLIINTATRQLIESANQRLQQALTEPQNEGDVEIGALFSQPLFDLLRLLWPEQMPVPPEFLTISLSIGLDEAAIRKQLEALEANPPSEDDEKEQILHEVAETQLSFAKLGEPSRWFTFSGMSRRKG